MGEQDSGLQVSHEVNGSAAVNGTPWQRYLAGLAKGYHAERAMREAELTPTALGHQRRGDPLARELEAAASVAGQRGDLADLGRLLAKGGLPVMVGDALKESRDEAIAPRDRLGNRRWVGEVAGVTGAAAAAPGITLQVAAQQVAIWMGGLTPAQLQGLAGLRVGPVLGDPSGTGESRPGDKVPVRHR